MKQTNYIFVFFICFFFFSCEKEEPASNNDNKDDGDEFYINPEDTAGIVVPEGYSLVIFPGNRSMTRAGGSETRIQHLQYIIYQNDGRGNYLQFYDNRKVNTDLTSWPVKAIAISLPKEKDYKVVFLGNVDKSTLGSNQTRDVLTGTGNGRNYTDARILLPSVEFADNNMYFFAKADFNTNVTAYVPITLKRIVSRNDITKEGLSGAYTSGVINNATYQTAYWTQTIKEKLKESIFTGENSTFRYQVAEGLKRNLIYPLIYIGLAKPEDATGLAAGYTAVAKYNAEWNSYKPADTYIQLFDGIRREYISLVTSGDQYVNNVFIRYAQYLYDAYVEETSKDPTTVTGGLNKIYTDNISIVENQLSQPSVDKAISKMVTALSANYTAGALLPWRLVSNYSIVNISPATPLPGGIDFELNTDATYNISGEKYYKMKDAPDNASDKYISVISLGEPQTSSNKLNITKLHSASSGGTTIDYIPTSKQEIVGSEFVTGSFHRNIKSVTTQKIQAVTLVNPKLVMTADTYKQKIEINYYHLFQAMNPIENSNSFTLGNDARARFTINNIPDATGKILRIQSYLLNWLNNNKYINMDSQDFTTLSFPFATFICPVVTPSNLLTTMEWKTIEVQ